MKPHVGVQQGWIPHSRGVTPLALIVYLGKLLGVLPVRYNRSSNSGPFQHSTFGLLLTGGQFCLLIWSLYTVVRHYMDTVDSQSSCSRGDNVANIIAVISQLLVVLVVLSTALLKQKSTLEYLNQIDSILAGQKTGVRFHATSFTVICFSMIVIVRAVILMTFTLNAMALFFVCYLIPIVVENISQMVNFVLERAFVNVCSELESLATVKVLWGTELTTPKGEHKAVVHRLDELRRTHGRLCDVAYQVNSRFGLDHLAILTVNFVQMVLFLYVIVWTLTTKSHTASEEAVFHVSQGMNILLNWTRFLYMCYRCDRVTSEARRAAVVLQKLMESTLNVDAYQEMTVFQEQIWSKMITFTACGFFRLDLALIRSIGGGVTTYLVMLLQFQTGEDFSGKMDFTTFKFMGSVYNESYYKLGNESISNALRL